MARNEADYCWNFGHMWVGHPSCHRCGERNPGYIPGARACTGSSKTPASVVPIPVGASKYERNNRRGVCADCGQVVAIELQGVSAPLCEHTRVFPQVAAVA